MIDKIYRATMLLLMLTELVLLGWLVAIEARHTEPVIYKHEIETVRPGRYVQFGLGPLLLDTETGQVCNSYAYEPDSTTSPYHVCPWIKEETK
jgi:hypothetical protein